MLYPKCPTCRTILANKQLVFEAERDKICDMKISQKEKDKLMDKLLNDLELIRYCCRQRMITYIPLEEIIH